MARLSETEKAELRRAASSDSLRSDMRLLRSTRHNPALLDGRMDLDRLMDFLTQCNAFMNHEPKPFAPMLERDIKM
jgi:hypothetical protein